MSTVKTMIRRAVLKVSTVFSLMFVGLSGTAWAQGKFDWDKWANALNENPCHWFSVQEQAKLIAQGAVAEAKNSRDATICTWRTAGSVLLLTISVVSMESAEAVNHGRNEQLNQIKNYGTKRFEEIPSPGGITTAIIRKDRQIVSIFANSAKEAAFIRISGHPVLNESPDKKTERKQRLRLVATEVINKFGF